MTNEAVPAGVNTIRRMYLALFAFFIAINLLQKLFNPFLLQFRVNREVLWYGNGILFLATAVSLFFLARSLKTSKAHTLLKNIYLALFIKIGICMVAAAAYILTAKKLVDKSALLGCAVLYVCYTALELYLVLKPKNSNPHAGNRSTP